MEIATRQNVAILDEQERIVGHGAVLWLDCPLHVGERLTNRTEDLRDAPQRVRILHALAVRVALAHRRPSHQLEHPRSNRLLLGATTQDMESRIKRSRRAQQGIDRHCSGDLSSSVESLGVRHR